MKKAILILCVIFFHNLANCQKKHQFLKENRFDLNKEIAFPQEEFSIVGFGAYHGSSKTEEAELKLISAILEVALLDYYIIETDQSIAHYFDQYLNTGDSILLKELVYHYGIRVPQEKSIETYKKWIKLYQLNQNLPDGNKIKVMGVDPIVSYKFTFKHLVDLLGDNNDLKTLNEIRNQLELDTTDFSPYYDSPTKLIMKRFVEEYKTKNIETENEELNQIIRNLEISFGQYNREKVIFENYLWGLQHFNLKNKKQFARYGFGHLEKEAELKDHPSFFAMLIENNIYQKKEIITIIGYLTKSQVLWNLNHDSNGNYIGYETEAGFGIGDYWREYFRGIRKLKRTKLSDFTLFRLNLPNSPYNNPKPDLIEIKMVFNKSNKKAVKGKATTSFLDYALLITDSKANRPLKEL